MCYCRRSVVFVQEVSSGFTVLGCVRCTLHFVRLSSCYCESERAEIEFLHLICCFRIVHLKMIILSSFTVVPNPYILFFILSYHFRRLGMK